MASINSTSINEESGCIANNLPLKVMRIGIENKGIFENLKPGALYCYTGKTQSVTVTLENGNSVSYDIPVTVAIDGPETLSPSSVYGIQFTVASGNVTGGKLVAVASESTSAGTE